MYSFARLSLQPCYKKFINNDCRISQIRAKSGNTGVHFDLKFEAAVRILAPNRKCIFKSPVRGCRGWYLMYCMLFFSKIIGKKSCKIVFWSTLSQNEYYQQKKAYLSLGSTPENHFMTDLTKWCNNITKFCSKILILRISYSVNSYAHLHSFHFYLGTFHYISLVSIPNKLSFDKNQVPPFEVL